MQTLHPSFSGIPEGGRQRSQEELGGARSSQEGPWGIPGLPMASQEIRFFGPRSKGSQGRYFSCKDFTSPVVPRSQQMAELT